MEIPHQELCTQQSANNSFFLCEEIVKSGNEWANEIPETKFVHGPMRRIELGRPSLAVRYEQQRLSANIRVSDDSEFAADRATRESTIAMVQRLVRHPIKTTSNLQTSVGFTVSECEFLVLVHGAAHGLGPEAYMRDLGVNLLLILESDSSSAKVCVRPRGMGWQRHFQTRYLWIQDMVAAN